MSLTRELIMDSALNIIDERGLEALSMRELGSSLGASTMSVYRYFSNKAELLDAVIDRILGELLPTPVEHDWKSQLRRIAERVRSVMIAHPHLAAMMGERFRRSPNSLKLNLELILNLKEAGVPEAVLSEAYWAIAVYTNGYSVLEARSILRQEARGRSHNYEQRRKKWLSILKNVEDPPGASSGVVASVLAHAIDDKQFEFGLDCLISGIEAQVSRIQQNTRND